MTTDPASRQPPADLIERILESLHYCLASTLLQTDDLLFALASSTEEGQEVNLHLDTLRFLRTLRSPLPLETSTVLRTLWTEETTHARQPPVAETAYVQSAITRHIEALHHPLIDVIRRRLSSARPEARAHLPVHAFDPAVIVQAIASALAGYGATENISTLVIRLLDQLLAPALGEFYAEIDQMLAAHGLAPERSSTLQIDHEASGVMDKAGLLEHLDHLQSRARQGADAEQALWVRGLPRLPDGAALPPKLKRPMELMGLLVYDTLTDEGITPGFKPILAKLHIPLLKAALLDDKVITQSRHPVRQAWQRLSECAKQPDAATQASTHDCQRLVDQLTDAFKRDLVVFDTLRDELTRLRNNAGPGVVMAVEQPAPAKISFEEASSLALATLRHALTGKRVPSSVRAFLMQAWSPLLMHLAQTEGTSAGLFEQASALMGKLIGQTAMPLQAGSGNPLETLESMLGLMTSRQGLPQGMDGLLPILRQELEATRRTSLIPSPLPSPAPPALTTLSTAPGTPSVTPGKPEPMPSPQHHVPRNLIDNYLRLAMHAGDWFLVHSGTDQPARRLKVFHVDPLRGVLVFSDRLDSPVMERPFTAFVDDLLNKLSRPVFEEERHTQALKQLRAQLEQDRQGAEQPAGGTSS